jgi:hypothetical protein
MPNKPSKAGKEYRTSQILRKSMKKVSKMLDKKIKEKKRQALVQEGKEEMARIQERQELERAYDKGRQPVFKRHGS